MADPLVTCLCCGAQYDARGDCPNLDRSPHSIELAAAVTRYLLMMGVAAPVTGDDVQEAVRALGRA